MLRAATPADLETVTSWIATPLDCERWAGAGVPFPIDLRTLPAAIGFDAAGSFALVDGERIVAFGQVLRKDAGRAHLARIIVDPAARGCGHGEALVRALVMRARNEPCQRVSLNVHAGNAPAVSLYLKMGFADAARPADEAGWPDTRYMELRTADA